MKTFLSLAAMLLISVPSAFGQGLPGAPNTGIAGAGMPAPPPNPMFKNFGMVPKFSPEFMQKMLYDRVNSGTILTGILQQDLHSGKNKAGDVFSILLEDGYSQNGKEVIPRGSMVLGSVIRATPARTRRAGNPGQLEVALQTLQLPDGRRCPLSGYISHNPNQDFNADPKKPSMGRSLANYGSSLKQSGMMLANTLTSRIGYNMMRPYKATPDFRLDHGEVLPIKLNRPLDVSQATFGPGLNPLAGGPMPAQGPAVPGMAGPDPDSIMQNLVAPNSQQPVYTPAPGASGEPF